MGNGNDQVPVKFLNVGAPGTEDLALQGGNLVTEMCTICFALVPTDKVQEHIDRHHQSGEDITPDWEPGRNISNRPDQGLPGEQPPPPEVSGGPPSAPDQGLPPEQPPPGEVSGGPPPTPGVQPADGGDGYIA